jgi:hypothetical protein
METAIMIDGAFIRKKYRVALKKDIDALSLETLVGNIFRNWEYPTSSTGSISMTVSPVQRKHPFP